MDRAAGFLARHRGPGVLLLPNAWDPGSARVLVDAGFDAVATTSAGIAFAAGLPDRGGLGRAGMLERIAAIAAAVPVPVSADVEAGYADDAAGVAETIRGVVAAGAVGANLEDAGDGALFDSRTAAERVAAARRAADAEGAPFTLNARIDAFLQAAPDPFAEVAERARRYREAGADCIFVPGVAEPDAIARVAELVDGPLNVVAGLSGVPLRLEEYERLGVRRVSIGGSLARAALGLVRDAALAMRADGRFDFASRAIPHEELNRLMG